MLCRLEINAKLFKSTWKGWKLNFVFNDPINKNDAVLLLIHRTMLSCNFMNMDNLAVKEAPASVKIKLEFSI